MGVNKVILIGNLGADPEVRHLEGNLKVASVRLATNEPIRTKEGNFEDHTEWHSLVMWRNLAERAEKFLKKGSQIYVEGRLRTRQWEDKEKVKRYNTEVLVDKMEIFGPRKEGAPEMADAASSISSNLAPEPDTESDDLPF
ncbi:MAG: single-stranded DNA-binding protein [Bacteroidetes bacterium]|nr:single-stranded DNA-binding protein [Bacteroidota bacterium]MBU1719851.1 single-stranded DNA-binding protein [Bacteroidota bacterium]